MQIGQIHALHIDEKKYFFLRSMASENERFNKIKQEYILKAIRPLSDAISWSNDSIQNKKKKKKLPRILNRWKR